MQIERRREKVESISLSPSLLLVSLSLSLHLPLSLPPLLSPLCSVIYVSVICCIQVHVCSLSSLPSVLSPLFFSPSPLPCPSLSLSISPSLPPPSPLSPLFCYICLCYLLYMSPLLSPLCSLPSVLLSLSPLFFSPSSLPCPSLSLSLSLSLSSISPSLPPCLPA